MSSLIRSGLMVSCALGFGRACDDSEDDAALKFSVTYGAAFDRGPTPSAHSSEASPPDSATGAVVRPVAI